VTLNSLVYMEHYVTTYVNGVVPNYRNIFSLLFLNFEFPLSNIQLLVSVNSTSLNLLKPTGYVMNQQFNIQQLYALPTLYLCVLYLSENKEPFVPLTA